MSTEHNKMVVSIRAVLIMAMLQALPLSSSSQYFQGLYDVDSIYNWGLDIFAQPDSNYFIMGWSVDQTTNKPSLFDMIISGNGNTVLSSNTLRFDSVVGLGNGNPGQAKLIPSGGYLFPITIQWPNYVTGYLYSSSGLAKLTSIGDTVFIKTYTDTSVYFDLMNTCAVMPDGGYVLGGAHAHNTPGYYYPAYIIRTDSMGDTLWTHTYQKYPDQAAVINTITPLNGGRMLVGAESSYQVVIYPYTYDHHSPWFMILDSTGNIIKDTVYGSKYGGGAMYDAIYTDMNGGYFHTGEIDTLLTTDPDDHANFPDYLAHLDTNFKIEWITRFDYSPYFGKRYIWMTRQLPDSSYLLIGDAALYYDPYAIGWAAKVSKNGVLIWNHYYISDSTNNAYFRDATVRSNGSLVFTGAAFNDTLPTWRQMQDVWLISTDSMGCLSPGGCDPDTSIITVDTSTTAAPSGSPRGGVTVYPNPTRGNFTVMVSSAIDEPMQLVVSNMMGEKVRVANGVTNKAMEIRLNAPPGVYFVFASSAGGNYVAKVVVE